MSSQSYVKGRCTHCIDKLTSKIPNNLAQTPARRQVSPLSSLSIIRRWSASTHHRLAAIATGRRKSASTAPPPSSFPTRPGSPILTDSLSKGSLTTGKHGRRWIGEKLKGITNRIRFQVVSADVLPDEVLLEIFYLYVGEAQSIQAWQSLVHVCRRWRSIIFESPNRLNLELFCTAKTPTRDMLDVWPALPLVIRGRAHVEEGVDNTIAALEHSDRVRRINLALVSSSHMEKLSAVMQVPFPKLTYLRLSSSGEVALPDSFLGGSAPRLRYFWLNGLPCPGLPKLLSSATHLVTLYLWNIPHSRYISPEAMLTALSSLTRLESLTLQFQSPLSRPDHATRRPPPATRSVLSVLAFLSFKGDSEYMEDLVARIDAPQLNKLYIAFFNDIVFDTPQLIQFVCRAPGLKALEKAHVTFDGGAAWVDFTSLTSGADLLQVKISCRELDWQVSSMEQVCTWSLPPLSSLEDLYIYETLSLPAHWQDNIDNSLWLELLHPFRAAKNLYLTKEFARRIVPVLQELVGIRATEVLPNLQNIFLERPEPSGRVEEGIKQFVATRQATSNPIAVSRWGN